MPGGATCGIETAGATGVSRLFNESDTGADEETAGCGLTANEEIVGCGLTANEETAGCGVAALFVSAATTGMDPAAMMAWTRKTMTAFFGWIRTCILSLAPLSGQIN